MSAKKEYCEGSGLTLRSLFDSNTLYPQIRTRHYCRDCKRVLTPTRSGKARPHVPKPKRKSEGR